MIPPALQKQSTSSVPIRNNGICLPFNPFTLLIHCSHQAISRLLKLFKDFPKIKQ